MHEVLVNHLVKLAQEKGKTDRPDRTTALDWDVKFQTKQTKEFRHMYLSTCTLVRI